MNRKENRRINNLSKKAFNKEFRKLQSITRDENNVGYITLLDLNTNREVKIHFTSLEDAERKMKWNSGMMHYLLTHADGEDQGDKCCHK